MTVRVLILAAVLLAGPVVSLRAADAKQTMTVAKEPPKNGFDEQHPDYLCIKEAVLTRESKQRFHLKIVLWGKLPPNPKEALSFYIGFDIDSDPGTGSASVVVPSFGQDVGVHLYQNIGDTKFNTYSSSVMVKGRPRMIDVNGFTARGDTVEMNLRSELFDIYDSFKFFLSTSQTIYDKGKKTSETQVSATTVQTFASSAP